MLSTEAAWQRSITDFGPTRWWV